MADTSNEAVKRPYSDFFNEGGQFTDKTSKKPNTGESEAMIDAALEYIDRGLSVFAIKENSKLPFEHSHGCKDKTNDKAFARDMFSIRPCNLAIATGSGLVVIDLDRGHSDGVDGVENFQDWEEKNGYFPDTWEADTPTGGRHIYLKTSMNVQNFSENAAHQLPPELRGIDLRGVGGYVVAAPSSIDGKQYAWDVAPGETDLAEADDLLSKLIKDLRQENSPKSGELNSPKSGEQKPPKKGELNPPESGELKIEKGTRNGTLTSYAGKLQRAGLPDSVIEAAITALNHDYCKPPVSDREVKTIVKSVSRYEKGDFQTAEDRPAAFTSYPVSWYLNKGRFTSDIDYFKKYKDRKTGFENIDENLTLYPGLAALGGQASIGKTSFCVNLADNLVKAGETVLYFALEQEPIELVTKSLARRLAEEEPGTRLTNTDIKNGATSSVLERVKSEYADEVADRLVIVRCDFTITAAAISNYIEQYIEAYDRRPCVIIDYLQLISPPDNFKGDTRSGIDATIKALKTTQVKNELLMILVSNFNRSSYQTPANYEDFKESGMIEYTCDYIWELQFSVMATDKFYHHEGVNNGVRETTKKEKSDMINKAITEYPKHIEFISLKSRNGRQSYKAFFKYYPDHDYFVPETAALYDDDLTADLEDDEGFQAVPDGYIMPFPEAE